MSSGHGGKRPGAGRPPKAVPDVEAERFSFSGLRRVRCPAGGSFSAGFVQVEAPGPLMSLEEALAAARSWLARSDVTSAAELLVSGASERGDRVAFGRLYRWHPERLDGTAAAEEEGAL